MCHWQQYHDLTFEQETHTYLWKGIRKPSVSQVLQSVGTQDPITGYWNPIGYGKFAKMFANSAEFGSAFHKVASGLLLGKTVKYPPEMDLWVIQFKRFLSCVPLIPLVDKNGNPIIEYPMYSVKHGYCGTPDLVAYNAKREICVIDWKTSSSHEKHYNYQTAAYTQMVEEIFKVKVKRRISVRITDEKFDLLDRTGHPEDLIMFNSCLNVLKMAA
jgi:hypothetical protein